MSRAFLVLGPESSGTRMWTQMLVLAGFEGQSGHLQDFDRVLPHASGSPQIVWRRSVPHDHQWPPIAEMAKRLRKNGYQVEALVLSRDHCAMAASQVEAPHVPDLETAYAHIRRAYLHIHMNLRAAQLPWTGVSMEALILHRDQYLRRLGERLRIPFPEGFPVEDVNLKWYT